MHEIKTIIHPIEERDIFDKAVSDRLKHGWEIKKIETINIQGEPNEVGSKPITHSIIAVLERAVII